MAVITPTSQKWVDLRDSANVVLGVHRIRLKTRSDSFRVPSLSNAHATVSAKQLERANDPTVTVVASDADGDGTYRTVTVAGNRGDDVLVVTSHQIMLNFGDDNLDDAAATAIAAIEEIIIEAEPTPGGGFESLPLLTAGDFGLLGGSGVTNTGSSVVNGLDVGSSPTPSVTGFPPGVVNNGTIYTSADPATAQAHADLIAAYTLAEAFPGGVAGPPDLGGATLFPGVYTYASSAPWTAGTLTLDAGNDPDAQWIFQIGTTLITPADAVITLQNGALASRIFWQVGSSATLGANNTFAGNILALTSVSLGGGTLDGRALAINGAVSIAVATTVNAPV